MDKRLIVPGVILASLFLGGCTIPGFGSTTPTPTPTPDQTYTQPTVVPTEVLMETPTETAPSGAMKAQTGVKEVTVEASNFKFTPATITVNKGETVRLTLNNKAGTHDWHVDEFNAATKLLQTGQSDTIEFTADKTGTFEYYCAYNSHRAMGMVGKLIVK